MSLHVALCGGNCPIWVNGPACQRGIDPLTHDTAVVPLEFTEFKKYVIVRHPLERLVSLWRHVQEWTPRLMEADLTFPQFVQNATDPPEGYYRPWHCTISELLGDIEAEPVRYEGLADNLARQVGIHVLLPHINKSNHGPCSEYYDAQTLETALTWARPDLERFAYDREFP
jgi:hypothetical protein